MADRQDALRRVQEAASNADGTTDGLAHANLLQAIRELYVTVERPTERLERIRMQPLHSLCIRLALEYGVLQKIIARDGKPVSASDLSKETGADELLIVRIMRLVTFCHVCDEVDSATYAANATTRLFSHEGYIGGEKHFTDLGFAVGSKLVELKRRDALIQFPNAPGEMSPFQYTYNMPFFDFFQQDPEQDEAFHQFLSVRRDTNIQEWYDVFPIEDRLKPGLKTQPDAVLIVDVGGSIGHELRKFSEAHATLSGRRILQDIPDIISKNENIPGGIELQEHDFFTPQPVRGARFYYFRAILHDWTDAQCQKILANTVAAMDKTYSTVLIDDYVLPDTGAGPIACSLDVLMFMFTSGIERTLTQWKTLLASVNLEIVNVWPRSPDRESVIEARICT